MRNFGTVTLLLVVVAVSNAVGKHKHQTTRCCVRHSYGMCRYVRLASKYQVLACCVASKLQYEHRYVCKYEVLVSAVLVRFARGVGWFRSDL